MNKGCFEYSGVEKRWRYWLPGITIRANNKEVTTLETGNYICTYVYTYIHIYIHICILINQKFLQR